jgi:hypothetical protein
MKGEIVDPFVKVEILTPGDQITEDSISVSVKTHHIDDDGLNPVWYDLSKMNEIVPKPTFRCEKLVRNIETCFLSLTVRDKDINSSEFLACGVIPVDCLSEGYRIVQLYDYKGAFLPDSHLFIFLCNQ